MGQLLQAACFPCLCERYFFLVNSSLEPKHHPQTSCIRIPWGAGEETDVPVLSLTN